MSLGVSEFAISLSNIARLYLRPYLGKATQSSKYTNTRESCKILVLYWNNRNTDNFSSPFVDLFGTLFFETQSKYINKI